MQIQIQMSSVRPDTKIINCWEGKIYPLIFLSFKKIYIQETWVQTLTY